MEYVKLKDVCLKIGSGSTPKGGASVYIDDGISLIRSQNIYNLTFSYKGLAHINEEAANRLRSVTIKKNDVLINITGDSVARTCMVPDDVLPARVNQHVSIIRPNSSILDPFYLSYYLASPFMQATMLNYATGKGASRNAMTKEMIGNYLIPCPSTFIQKKIVGVLKQYDNLIENNNKRIKLLEQMAENLYKEWFVRFRFPGYEDVEFNNSSLGKIPSTFDIVKIGKVIEYYIGGGWGEEELSEQFPKEAYVVRGTDFPNVKYGMLDSCPLRYHKLSNYSKRAFQVNDIAFEVSGGTQKQPVGRSVLITERQLKRFNNRLICASFCKLIRCDIKKVSPRYFYHWLQYLYETKVIEQYQLQSTGIINFKFEYFLRKCNFLIPPKDIMEKFEESVKPIYDEIDILAEQNSKLITQRDMLLPRLMSGKLEV